MKKAQKYTHQSAYKDYVKMVEDKDSILSYKDFDRAIRSFMYKLNREIIVEKYEWKLPFGGGYIRIAKDKRGMFFWYWDRANDYCRIPKKRLWSFRAVRGWQDKLIGSRGLVLHYFACLNNPKVENYSVPRIDHAHDHK